MLVELQHLLAEYWASVDRLDDAATSPASFFAPHGEMVLGALEVRGREGLEGFFRQRNAAEIANQRTTRHVFNNLRLRVNDADHFVAYATVMVFSGIGGRPLPSQPPSAIGDFGFCCVRDGSRGWLFEKVVGTSVFIGEGAPSFASIQR